MRWLDVYSSSPCAVQRAWRVCLCSVTYCTPACKWPQSMTSSVMSILVQTSVRLHIGWCPVASTGYAADLCDILTKKDAGQTVSMEVEMRCSHPRSVAKAYSSPAGRLLLVALARTHTHMGCCFCATSGRLAPTTESVDVHVPVCVCMVCVCRCSAMRCHAVPSVTTFGLAAVSRNCWPLPVSPATPAVPAG